MAWPSAPADSTPRGSIPGEPRTGAHSPVPPSAAPAAAARGVPPLDTARPSTAARAAGPPGAAARPVLSATPVTAPASPVGRRVRVPKTAELVAGQLRRRIIRGELREGDALPPEPTLMTQFGVSRPTLREAFRVLEAEALISVRRGAHGGARVHTPSAEVAARYAGLVLEHRGATLGDVHQACAVIEPPCAALLAERHDPADVARLRQLLSDGDDVFDHPAALAAAQAAFHLAVVELTGNKSLSVVTGMLQHLVELTNNPTGQPAPDAPVIPTHLGGPGSGDRLAARATRRMHAALIELVEVGDAAGAADLWSRHLAAPDHAIPGGPSDRCMLDLLG